MLHRWRWLVIPLSHCPHSASLLHCICIPVSQVHRYHFVFLARSRSHLVTPLVVRAADRVRKNRERETRTVSIWTALFFAFVFLSSRFHLPPDLSSFTPPQIFPAFIPRPVSTRLFSVPSTSGHICIFYFPYSSPFRHILVLNTPPLQLLLVSHLQTSHPLNSSANLPSAH